MSFIDTLPRDELIRTACSSGLEKGPGLARKLAYEGFRSEAIDGGVRGLLSEIRDQQVLDAYYILIDTARRGQGFEQALTYLKIVGLNCQIIDQTQYLCIMSGGGVPYSVVGYSGTEYCD